MELQGIWAWPFSRQETITNGCAPSVTQSRALRTTYLRDAALARSVSASPFVMVLRKLKREQEGIWMQRAARVDHPCCPPLRSLASPWLIFHGGRCSPCGWGNALPQAMRPWLRGTLFLLFTLRYWTLLQLLIIFQLLKTNEKVREVSFLSDPTCQLLWLFINVGAGFGRFFLSVLKNKREISSIVEVI